MNARQKRRIRRWVIAGAGLTAAGVVVGYRYVEFGVPSATIPVLWRADRAARRERAA